jgi:hypothetical protein
MDLVGIFFSEVNWFSSVVEPYYFYRMHSSWTEIEGTISEDNSLHGLSRDLQYFPALLFQVLAVALQFLPPDSQSIRLLELNSVFACDKLSFKYSEIGVTLMSVLGPKNTTVTAIEHDLMRCSWLKNVGRGSESWYILGNAIRKAQELGLYLQSDLHHAIDEEVGKKLEATWHEEYKKRVWVKLFNWDSHMAMLLGRPRIINAADCTIKEPLDCNFPEHPSSTIPTPNWHDRPSSYTFELCQYSISHCIHEMLSSGASKRYCRDYKKVADLQDKVITLIDALPPIARPSEPDISWDLQLPDFPRKRQQLLCAANSFLMALHRSHITTHGTSRRAAIQAALQVLDAQQKIFDLVKEHHYMLFGLSFFTVDAGILLSAITIKYPPDNHVLVAEINSSLQKAIRRLTLMKERNKIANSGVQVLRRCYDQIQESLSLKNPEMCNRELNLDLSSGNPQLLAELSMDETQSQTLPPSLYGMSATNQDILAQPLQTNGIMLHEWNMSCDQIDFDETFWMDQLRDIVGLDIDSLGPTVQSCDTTSHPDLSWGLG